MQFSKKKFLRSVSFAAWACAFIALAACSGESGTDSDTTRSAFLQNAEVYPTFEDLPNCTEKRQGDTSYVEADSSISVCLDERWQKLGKLVETEEDLQNCTEKREGMLAYIQEFQKTYECTGKNWVEKAIEDSSDKNRVKEDDERNDGETTSLSSGKSSSKSSSSKTAEPESSNKSSSSTDIVGSSSSVKISIEDDESITGSCTIESGFTSETSGPHNQWGYFGFVIPFRIIDSKTQKIFIKISDESNLAGPSNWDRWSVLIAKYDESTGNWVYGSEIFSKKVFKNGPYSNVYTDGYAEIDFDIEGTWLADKSLVGKKVYVAINFYNPYVPSDSSGTGFDFYSVPDSVNIGGYSKIKPSIGYVQKLPPDCEGLFVDSRNNKTYKTITIDSMTAMTEMMIYDHGNFKISEEGNLYTWNSAIDACPNGWHLPTKAELSSSLAEAFGTYIQFSADFWTSSKIEGKIESADSVYTYYVDSAYTYNIQSRIYQRVAIDSFRTAFCIEGKSDVHYPSLAEVVDVDEIITSSTFTLTLENEKKKVAFDFSGNIFYHPVTLSSGTSIVVNGTEYSGENCRFACTIEPETFERKIVEFEAKGKCTITSSKTICE